MDNRLRYPFEVFVAVRAAWLQDGPMSVRISANDWVEGGITPSDAVLIAKAFKAAGADRSGADLPRRLAARPGADGDPRGGHGQDDRHRERPTGDRRGRADLRRPGRDPRSSRRTAVPRDPRPAHVRGRHRGAATHHIARDHLPPAQLQPEYLFELPELQFPEQINCATELLDRHVEQGRGDWVCIRAHGLTWTYADLLDKANRIANVLVNDMGLVPGNRVLLRAPNNPMLAACWFGVMKAGGIAVATMPLLRAKELKAVVEIGQVTHALCDAALAEELRLMLQEAPQLRRIRHFNYVGPDSLEVVMERASPHFDNVATAADDTCIFGFTSGTTGVPKATMHYHRDVMAICHCWPAHVLRPTADDVFIGSPPLAFTFGLGGLVLFPLSVGASTVLLEKASPQQLLEGIEEFGATVLFTAPTSYRTLAARGVELRRTPLRKCVSAGEALPASTRELWKDATGIELIDGIGATEMLHIFISHHEDDARPGATGKPVPGYRAKVIDDDGREVPPGTVGKLAVQGPTGCRYLADERQKAYVKNGWNVTGDAYLMDAEGYFFYQARTDDMIVSAGYNIAAPEVEEALMQHPAVAECAVIGVADAERGQIVKAFIVLRPGHAGSDTMAKTLQDFVKSTVAPYKYPRAVEFIDKLPRTQTGKLQRFKLQELQ